MFYGFSFQIHFCHNLRPFLGKIVLAQALRVQKDCFLCLVASVDPTY